MNRNVVLRISGLHRTGAEKSGSQPEADETGSSMLETVAEAQYFERNGAYFCLYEEQAETGGNIRSRLKLQEHCVELVRRGALETHMIFEEGRAHRTPYQTPFGVLQLDIHTQKIRMLKREDSIRVSVEYTLEADGAFLSAAGLEIEIRNMEREAACL